MKLKPCDSWILQGVNLGESVLLANAELDGNQV